ncbi:MAG: PatB family C-S lyase [Acidobacteria bacterium]|nr:PatB family C-S lyase [Acidobacteriota bacterium]
MKYDFDTPVERRGTDSAKWGVYPEKVIPMWVADMDFVSAVPIVHALHRRSDHGVFGYSRPSHDLKELIRDRVKRLYNWDIAAPDILFLPGIVTGLNIAFQAFAAEGEGVLAQPPVYFHFLRDPVFHGRILQDPPLVRNGNTYEIDFDLFERAITETTKLFVLCNPHNPVGRVFTKEELERIADICLRHELIICSDEIHCDLIYSPFRHIPIATLSPEVEASTVTLMSPSKTFNIAGLGCGYALIRNPRLRKYWNKVIYGIIPHVNIMGYAATEAGLREGGDWLDQVLTYLRANRDYVSDFIGKKMPSIRISDVEATYLAWLDCTEMGIEGSPARYFREKAHVALSDGEDFGKNYEKFVRLNFACPRKVLDEALNRMASAINCI